MKPFPNLDKAEVLHCSPHAKISQFKIMLQSIKKGPLSMNEYLLKVKNTMDRLASVDTLSDSDHIEFILNGLPENYDTFIVSVKSRSESYSVEEI